MNSVLNSHSNTMAQLQILLLIILAMVIWKMDVLLFGHEKVKVVVIMR